MGRSATSIQAAIDTLETYLQSTDSLVSSVGSGATSLTRAQRKDLSADLRKLYIELGRANGTAPMFVRGVVKGMR